MVKALVLRVNGAGFMIEASRLRVERREREKGRETGRVPAVRQELQREKRYVRPDLPPCCIRFLSLSLALSLSLPLSLSLCHIHKHTISLFISRSRCRALTVHKGWDASFCSSLALALALDIALSMCTEGGMQIWGLTSWQRMR